MRVTGVERKYTIINVTITGKNFTIDSTIFGEMLLIVELRRLIWHLQGNQKHTQYDYNW